MVEKVDITVVSTPVSIGFECPHCEEDVHFDYSDFVDQIGQPCDWKYSKIECPECGIEIEIDDVEWD